MIPRLKSAFIHATVLCLGLFILIVTLAACTDDESFKMPHVFTGNEVPPEAFNENRVVTTALPGASDQAAYPRLGEVPSKPKDFTSLPLINQSMAQMEHDREVAAQKRAAVEGNVPPYATPALRPAALTPYATPTPLAPATGFPDTSTSFVPR